MTIHGISTGLDFMSYVSVPFSKLVVHFSLVDLGWWVTILWMVSDHPDTSPGLNLVSQIYVPNSKSVVHFPLVELGWWVPILWMVGDHHGDGD